MNIKKCKRCEIDKEIFFFNKRQATCKDCEKKYKDEYYKKNKNNLLPSMAIYYKLNKEKIGKDIKEKGLTVVPSSIFFTKNGLVKLEINLARGKNTVNKKKSIKERDLKREFKKEI